MYKEAILTRHIINSQHMCVEVENKKLVENEEERGTRKRGRLRNAYFYSRQNMCQGLQFENCNDER